MAIKIHRAFVVHDDALIAEGVWPRRWAFTLGDVAGVLTRADEHPQGDGPCWTLPLVLGEGAAAREVVVPLHAFLSVFEYDQSMQEPFSFTQIQARGGFKKPEDGEHGETEKKKHPAEGNLDWLWLFRDALYVAERIPAPSEIDEVVLRIKALHFQQDEEIRRLREKVANFEAIDTVAGRRAGRQPIPDDVKLLVWSRDGGVCVKCSSSSDLHFDHVIPVAKGGGDHAENIQLLCRICNLAKSDRLA